MGALCGSRGIGDSVDAIVALTHLSIAMDQRLAEEVPAIDLILGGHEHENYFLRRGERLTPIIKADANVRTVAVITLRFSGTARRPDAARLSTLSTKYRESRPSETSA